VQTLSQLNRAYQVSNGEKTDRMLVLDFVNQAAAIQAPSSPSAQ
jgi:hypothetical protein